MRRFDPDTDPPGTPICGEGHVLPEGHERIQQRLPCGCPDPPDELEHLQVLRLQPGDTLVLQVQGTVTPDQYERIKRQFRERFPDYPAVVLDDGMQLGVVRGPDLALAPDGFGTVERRV